MTEQERLFRRISAFRFSMWELHMFLDTHPNNCDAAKKLEEYRLKTDELTKKYEAEFGPLNETSSQTSRWAWISGPWPWENGTEMDGDLSCGSMRKSCKTLSTSKTLTRRLQS